METIAGVRDLKNKLSHYLREVKKGRSIMITEPVILYLDTSALVKIYGRSIVLEVPFCVNAVALSKQVGEALCFFVLMSASSLRRGKKA
jgi:hypothetical protein